MGEGKGKWGDDDAPLLDGAQDGHIERTGTAWTASAHIITTVIGSGVLSLAWSVAQLGWIAGPTAILFFAAVTFVQSSLLADCYRSPDPEHGHIRNYSYMDAVKLYLGQSSLLISGVLRKIGLFGGGIAYTITAATSARAIQISICDQQGGCNEPSSSGFTLFILLFGAIQLVLSQIPNFHSMEWLSILAAIMSFCYSFIGFGLGLAKVIANGTVKGGLGGIPAGSAVQKMWLVSQGIGDIAFAYPYSIILLEIQDTLKSPPAENQTMKKASIISIVIITFFYICCGCLGYAAFGDDTPGNLLTGFRSTQPYWLVDFANACIILHLIGAYQMFSQPVFAYAEGWYIDRFPDSSLVNSSFTIQLPTMSSFKLILLKLCFRTVYVLLTTGIAVLFPYFNQVLGLVGALYFWPLAIYFPVEMYLVQCQVTPWTRKWVVLRTFSYGCLLVSAFALVGSVEGLFAAKRG